MRCRVLIGSIFLTVLACAGHLGAAGVTIIIHGWHVSGMDTWFPAAMQAAVDEDWAASEGNLGTITVTGLLDLTAVGEPWNVALSSSSTGEIVVAVDWHAVADHLVSRVAAQEVAAVIVPMISEGQSGNRPLAELPIHLIGHSRGGGMVCEIARLLGEQGIEVDHLTPLDPHPLTVLDPQTIPPIIDTPSAVYENVLFADSYWQPISYPEGEVVAGAINREWTSIPGGYHDHVNVALSAVADHLNIHLAYHATVDLATPTTDGEGVVDSTERAGWFNVYETDGGIGGQRAGFVYSRIVGGDRMSTDTPVPGGDRTVDGYHDDPVLGGGGTRAALSWSTAVWPNVITLTVAQGGVPLGPGDHSLAPGAALDLLYTGRDFDSSSNVTLFFDADRNPYNSNSIATIASASHGASGPTIFQSTEGWDTSSITVGTVGFVFAKITDGTRTRYLYAAPKLVFGTEIFSDGFESAGTDRWSSSTE